MQSLRLSLYVVCLWLGFSMSSSFKHNVKSDASHDATTAAGVAEAAFKRGRISRGLMRAMSNASLLVEAAESSGLAWTHAHSQQLIAKAAAHLESHGGLGAASATSADEDMKAMQSDLEVYGRGREVMNLAVTASVGLMSTWLENGEVTFYDAYSIARDIGLALFSAAFPILGQVVALAFTFFEGLFGLGSGGESPEEKLYKEIIKETRVMIDQEFVLSEIGDRMTDMSVMMDEMRWVPTMLNNVHGDARQHTLLMYYVMLLVGQREGS